MSSINKKLTSRQLLKALGSVMLTTYRAAPLAAIVQIFSALVTAVLPIATVFFAARATTALADAYAGDEQAGEMVFTYVGLTALLGITSSLWGTVESYLEQLLSYKIEVTVNDRLYEHFHQIDFWHYDSKDTVDMYDRARRFANFFPMVFRQLMSIVTQILIFVVALWSLIIVSWWLGVILIVAVIPGILWQLKLSRLGTAHWQSNVETRRRRSWIEWSVMEPGNIAELRLYGMAKHLIAMRTELRDRDEKARLEFERQYIFKRFFSDALEAVAEVTALVWTVLQIIAQQQPVGQFLFVQQVVSRALGSINSLVSTIASIDEDVANLYDYHRFMNLPTMQQRNIPTPVLSKSISLQDVSFSYPESDTQVLSRISLEIKKGTNVAIVGENGAGKSTLIKLLTGLYAPTSGKVLIDGYDLAKTNVDSWHEQISMLHQNFINYTFATVRENVLFGDYSRSASLSAIEAALDHAMASSFVHKLPKGIDNYVNKWMETDDGERGTDLSGGQWQRLALARNFYRDSPIVILDEPTSAVDALAEARIFTRLFKHRDKTIITISHRLTTIEQADVIYMLHNGRVVEHGSHKELVSNRSYYYKMFESQLKA